MKKKALTSIATTALAFSLVISGCSNNGSPKNEGGNASPDSTDKRGKTTVTVQDRGTVASAEGTYEDNRWTKWILENGPVDASFVPILRSESKKILNTLFASGSAPDIINETNTAFRNNLYEQKQLLPLDDQLQYMPNYQALIDQYPQLKQVGTKPDGKLYEIGRVNEASMLHVMFIRTDWLEKLKLEMPTTIDELLEVAIAFATQDPDGNNKADTYGMNISYYSEGAVNEMFGVQQDTSWGLKDGQVVRQWDKELAALSFKKALYEGKAIDRDYISDKDGTKAKQDFLNGKIGIYVNYSMNWFEFTTKDYVTLQNNVPGATIAPLAYPETPFGQYTGAMDNPIQMTTAFNVNTPDPKAAAEYVNFILDPKVSQLLMKGEEGVHWKQGDNGCAVILDSEKFSTEVGYAAGYGLFLSRGTDKCNFVNYQFDESIPEQKIGLDLYKQTRELYMDSSKEYPGITLGDHLPGLDSELALINTTILTEIQDIFVKAIVNGSSYSPETAIADAQHAWKKAGGQKIEDFINNWYQTNKDTTAFLADDLWYIVEQQKELVNK